MHDTPSDIDRLLRVLTGEASEQEEVDHWQRLAVDAGYGRLHREMVLVWEGLDVGAQAWDAETALVEIRRRGTTPDRGHAVPASLRRRARLRRRGVASALAALAGVGAVMAAVWWAWEPPAAVPRSASIREPQTPSMRNAHEPAAPVPMVEIARHETGRGEQRRVRLSDGSVVTLYPGARLRVLAGAGEAWGRERRQVALQGEAFFSIARDSLHPFIVEAAHAEVRVLGTQFVVSTAPVRFGVSDPEAVAVAVREGHVRVQHTGPIRATPAPTRELRAGDAVIMRGRGTMQSMRAADVLEASMGRLAFVDAPLERVVAELRRWHNVDLVLAPTVDRRLRITARFEPAPVSALFDQLAFVSGLQLEQRGARFVLFP